MNPFDFGSLFKPLWDILRKYLLDPVLDQVSEDGKHAKSTKVYLNELKNKLADTRQHVWLKTLAINGYDPEYAGFWRWHPRIESEETEDRDQKEIQRLADPQSSIMDILREAEHDLEGKDRPIRLLLYGWRGSGKTTAMRYLTDYFVGKALRSKSSKRVPILFPLVSPDEKRGGFSLSGLDLKNEFNEIVRGLSPEPEKLELAHLHRKNCKRVFLFDCPYDKSDGSKSAIALFESLDGMARQPGFMDDSFICSFSSENFLEIEKVAGDNWQRAETVGFNDELVERYLKTYGQREKVLKAIEDNGLKGLAYVPYLLDMIVKIVDTHRSLPKSAGELIAKFEEVLFDARYLQYPQDLQLSRILAKLSLKAHLLRTDQIPYKILRQIFDEEIAGANDEESKKIWLRLWSTALVVHLAEQLNRSEDVAPEEMVEFVWPTLREYYMSRAIDFKLEGVPSYYGLATLPRYWQALSLLGGFSKLPFLHLDKLWEVYKETADDQIIFLLAVFVLSMSCEGAEDEKKLKKERERVRESFMGVLERNSEVNASGISEDLKVMFRRDVQYMGKVEVDEDVLKTTAGLAAMWPDALFTDFFFSALGGTIGSESSNQKRWQGAVNLLGAFASPRFAMSIFDKAMCESPSDSRTRVMMGAIEALVSMYAIYANDQGLVALKNMCQGMDDIKHAWAKYGLGRIIAGKFVSDDSVRLSLQRAEARKVIQSKYRIEDEDNEPYLNLPIVDLFSDYESDLMKVTVKFILEWIEDDLNKWSRSIEAMLLSAFWDRKVSAKRHMIVKTLNNRLQTHSEFLEREKFVRDMLRAYSLPTQNTRVLAAIADLVEANGSDDQKNELRDLEKAKHQRQR
jgi:hypothetical protein